MKILVNNRRANFDYEILERYEAGIVLLGCEVKSLKAGQASLENSFANFLGDKLYLINAYIPPWQPANAPFEYEPTRARVLLLKKKELNYLIGKLKEKGLKLVPLAFYLKNNKIKVELGLGRWRKKIDKRERIKERELRKTLAKQFKI